MKLSKCPAQIRQAHEWRAPPHRYQAEGGTRPRICPTGRPSARGRTKAARPPGAACSQYGAAGAGHHSLYANRPICRARNHRVYLASDAVAAPVPGAVCCCRSCCSLSSGWCWSAVEEDILVIASRVGCRAQCASASSPLGMYVCDVADTHTFGKFCCGSAKSRSVQPNQYKK